MDNTKKFDVLIIGGGPAGLTLAHYLQEKGVNYAILEKGKRAGESWRTMPEHLHLISLWKSNVLIPEDLPLFSSYKAHSAQEFSKYLEELVERKNLNFIGEKNVIKIEKVDSTFIVESEKERYFAHLVVDCRGYYSYPFIPSYKMSGNLPLMIHFKEFKNALQFKEHHKICIVGKRLSAGQIIKELVDSDPTKKIFLSARSKITFGTAMFIFNFILRHLDILEFFLKKIVPIKKTLEIPMHRDIKKYVEERVIICGDITSIQNNTITFDDGKTQEVDAVIFTTGFKRPPIVFRDDFEDKSVDGLYYLGINAQRTFTSRFLRGIREDAKVLAQLILERLASKNNCQ